MLMMTMLIQMTKMNDDDNDCYDGEGIDDDNGDDAKVATKVFPAD